MAKGEQYEKKTEAWLLPVLEEYGFELVSQEKQIEMAALLLERARKECI